MQRTYFALFLFFLLSSLFYLPAHGQKTFGEIDWSRVQHKKIQKLIEDQQALGRSSIIEIEPSCFGQGDTSGFFRHQKTYQVKMGLNDLWSAYLTADPATSWNSKIVSYAMLYQPSTDKIYYPQDNVETLSESQMIFLNLRILGLVNIGVAHQINKIDPEEKLIRLCYLDCGKSKGSQEIQLRSISPELTEVVHISRFKSDSAFRDKNLYPYFHEKAIDQFHQNIEQWAKNHKTVVSKN